MDTWGVYTQTEGTHCFTVFVSEQFITVALAIRVVCKHGFAKTDQEWLLFSLG